MKRLFSTILVLVLMLVMCLPVLSLTAEAKIVDSGICGDKLTWSLDDKGTLTISGTGPMRDYSVSSPPWRMKRDAVKKINIEDGVTSISDTAFASCSNLKSVSIPDSVSSMGDYVFRYCTSLTSVNIPDGVTRIGKYAFDECSSLTSIVIPDSATSIGDAAFKDCTSLTSVTIGVGVTNIGLWAFENCLALETINYNATTVDDLPDNNYVFYDAGQNGNGVTVNIGANVTHIPAKLFYPREDVGLAKIKTVNFEEGSVCKTIGDYAFAACTGLTSITIVDSVTKIGSYAYKNCFDVETINFNATAMDDLPGYNGVFYSVGKNSENLTVNIGANVTRIPACLFKPHADSVHSYIRTVNFEEGSVCKTIGDSSFNVCFLLENIVIPDGVTSIDDYAFWQCSGMTSITIPVSVTTIGSGALPLSWMLDKIYYTGTKSQAEKLISNNHLVVNKTQWYYNCKIAKITKQPTSAKAVNGEDVKVSFTATGDGLTYKWYYKEKNASAFKLTTSFTGNTYAVQMNAERNGRQLYCVVTDQYGNSVKTNTVTIGMSGAVVKKAKITKQPTAVTVANGAEAKVTFTATGDGLTYKWYFKNKGASSFALTTTFTGNTYTAQMNADRNGRQIYCVVTDKYGNSVKTNTVTIGMSGAVVKKAKITKQPTSVTVANGAEAKVTFAAIGDGLTYKWYYKSKGMTGFVSTTSFTGNTYNVQMNADRNGRQIYCVVTDKYGNSVKTNTVTIGMQNKVKITKQPSSAIAGSGEEVKISVGATGDGLTYKWYYKSKGMTGFVLTTSFTGNTYNVQMNADRHGRQIYCVVTDKYGNSVKTNTITIGMQNKAKITKQPTSVTVANGAEAKVTFTATGDGLTYKWYYKSKGMTGFVATTSFTGNTYNVQMNADRNGRQIYCVVTDKYGNKVQTNTVTIGISSNLVITKQPTSVTVADGAEVKISFTATGEGLTYKWYYKSKGMTGFVLTTTFTGNTYTTQMNADRSGRQLYCVVTDKYGNSIKTDTVIIDMVIGSGTCGANLKWTLSEGGNLTISGSGEMNNYSFGTTPWDSSLGIIKKVVIEDGVTSIGDYALFNCSELTDVSIPNSVTIVGDYAFGMCTKMTDIVIPGNVTSIGDYAFYICNHLTTVTICDGVTSIGVSAFNCCTSLTSITIADSVTSIGASAFSDCNSLTSIVLPSGLTYIEEKMFQSCRMTSITIPDGVTSIGESAFWGCVDLSSVKIPDSVKNIGNKAFMECPSLRSAYYKGTESQAKTITIGSDNSVLLEATWHYNAYA